MAPDTPRTREQVHQSHRELSIKATDSEEGSAVEATAYAGPLPTPQTLAAFEGHIPGSAERILAMAEGEQKHRHVMERAQVELASESRRLDHRAMSFSLFGGVFVSVVFLAGAVYGGIELHAGVFSIAVAPFIFLMTQLSPSKEDPQTGGSIDPLWAERGRGADQS